jgi:putative holliday junction resolvase
VVRNRSQKEIEGEMENDTENDTKDTEKDTEEGDRALGPRILALDVGDRRIGVAISDELGLTAQPVLTVERRNPRHDVRFLVRLMRRYGCSQVIVGNPLYMSGDVSPQARKAQAFAQTLEAEGGVQVILWDERLTTTEAHRHLDAAGHQPGGKRRAVIDQVAAVLILQSFLDAHPAH